MKVQNMTSNNGNKIANQFRIDDHPDIYFQSYDKTIVGETIKDTKAKIKSGEYILTDLNK